MRFNEPISVLAVRDRDADALRRAASGGAFCVLARPVIAQGGVVFGAVMSDGGAVAHARAEDLGGLARMQGSAYVQSDVSGVYDEVVESVREGRLTLFTGLPCQCAAVGSYVRARLRAPENPGNLLLCDLVCHGAPNNELFRAHQSWLARRLGADDGVHSFRFRTKRRGWGLFYHYYYLKGGKRRDVCAPGDDDPYYAAFLRGETYRESCYSCPFARRERATDFTIGDYWGIASAHPGFDSKDGASLLLLNTPRAVRFFNDRAASGCDSVASDMGLAMRENHNLNGPTARPAARDALLDEAARLRAEGDLERIFDGALRPKPTLKRLVRRVLPPGAYNTIKRIAGRG